MKLVLSYRPENVPLALAAATSGQAPKQGKLRSETDTLRDISKLLLHISFSIATQEGERSKDRNQSTSLHQIGLRVLGLPHGPAVSHIAHANVVLP